MSREENVPHLDGAMIPTETTTPDHREHAKTPKHLDDQNLTERANHEKRLLEQDAESSSTERSD
ncbi:MULTISPECIES: hypothetical protein [Nocardiaceae]|uniref:hypothetical protein n=1 Tax=Nocardiaceae TaxID=85025 RepID=UPI000D7CB7FA|nr:hypothetical protein [Williamsia limnetica]